MVILVVAANYYCDNLPYIKEIVIKKNYCGIDIQNAKQALHEKNFSKSL